MNYTLDEFGNYIGHYDDYIYEDGIMNNDLYLSEKIKILWILKETHGKFNVKNYWGRKIYLQNNEPFNKNKQYTWKSAAKITYQILNGCNTDNPLELAACLERIAIINLKKTPGKEKVNKEYHNELKNDNNRTIFIEQIKRINPDVIIGANTLNKIKQKEIPFRNGERIYLNKFSDDLQFMEKNSCFCFSNKLFINPYHPSHPMDKNEYVKVVVAAFHEWMKIKDNCPLFEW